MTYPEPTSSPAGSPASPSPPPASDGGRMMSGGSGPSSPASFAYYDPAGCSWRTCPDSSALPTSTFRTDAYAAGLLDGEGCLYLSKSKNWYSPRIDMGMTDKAEPLLRALAEEFGGTVRQTRPATQEWGRAVCWTATGPVAISCLRRVLPHLKLKQEQARLLVWLDEQVSRRPNGNIRWDDESRGHAEWVRSEIKELNRKGPTVVPHAGAIWQTSQGSLFEEWATYSATWPGSGMTRSGAAYRLPTSAPRIFARGSGLWPTPNSEGGTGYMSGSNRDTWRPTLEGAARMAPEGPPPKITAEEYRGKGRKAAMLLTPTASSYGTNQGGGMGRIGPIRPSLETMARHGLWPTPQAHDARPGHPAMWPTPTARDGTSGPGHSESAEGSPNLRSMAGGALNPTWVEWLMGLPLGWTELGSGA